MLNEGKIRIMNRLAIYEKTEGKKYLPISKYYRSDYIGLALIRNFFLVTLGYALALGAIALYFAEYLLNNLNKIDLLAIGEDLLIGYGIVLILFSLLTYILYSVQYHKAKKSVRGYYDNLTRLEKIYNREEKASAGNRGGVRN